MYFQCKEIGDKKIQIKNKMRNPKNIAINKICGLSAKSSIWILLLSACAFANAISLQTQGEQQDADIVLAGFMSTLHVEPGLKSFVAVIDDVLDVDKNLVERSYCYGDDNHGEEGKAIRQGYVYTLGTETKVCMPFFSSFFLSFFFLYSFSLTQVKCYTTETKRQFYPDGTLIPLLWAKTVTRKMMFRNYAQCTHTFDLRFSAYRSHFDLSMELRRADVAYGE